MRGDNNFLIKNSESPQKVAQDKLFPKVRTPFLANLQKRTAFWPKTGILLLRNFRSVPDRTETGSRKFSDWSTFGLNLECFFFWNLKWSKRDTPFTRQNPQSTSLWPFKSQTVHFFSIHSAISLAHTASPLLQFVRPPTQHCFLEVSGAVQRDVLERNARLCLAVPLLILTWRYYWRLRYWPTPNFETKFCCACALPVP